MGKETLPHDELAEKATLGALLLANGDLPEIHSILSADDFYMPVHATVYEAINHLWTHNNPADAVTVADYIDKQGQLSKIGGATYLLDLMESSPTAANASYYANIIKEKSTLRKLIRTGSNIVNYAYSAEESSDLEYIIDKSQAEIFQVLSHKNTEDYTPLKETYPPTVEEMLRLANDDGSQFGVLTGIDELDDMTSGLRGGQMIIVAARPAVGKSTFALDVMRNTSLRYGKTSVMFSLEMSRTEVTMRLLSAELQIPLTDMTGGKMTDLQWSKIMEVGEKISQKPLFIDDSPNLTMLDIRAKARRLKQQHGLDLIVVDYLQLMSSGKRVEGRQQEVSEFSRQLKLLAKELDVPVIAVAQLNRNPEQRIDRRPQVSDIRESGSLEQDADIVLLLHRPELFDGDSGGEAEIIVGKHRGGPTGTVGVIPQMHFSRFVNKIPTLEK